VKINFCYRHGYESSGGFGVDEFLPLPGETVRPVAPAYRVYPSAMKLDKKDSGPTGKSGNSCITYSFPNFISSFSQHRSLFHYYCAKC
jgi:hypothetical protein